jgi:hypothetical protein
MTSDHENAPKVPEFSRFKKRAKAGLAVVGYLMG